MKSLHLSSRLSIALPTLVLTVLLFLFPTQSLALSSSEFRAGHLIDDSIFFNPTSMGAQEIQSFLNAKVPNCDTNGDKAHSNGSIRRDYAASEGYSPPFTCLKDYRQDVPATPADSYCSSGISSGNKSAAEIINDVAKACGINPMALIVTLQKEQSLVTDEWPWSIQYRSATGFGCPDTASCDSAYYGFFNQVYYAARQFQRYVKQSSQYNFQHGRKAYVQYKPNSGCGSSEIYMETQATAGLYNYTPYQPNAAALNNLYGNGDSCSSYGNRNFWRTFNDWFGSTISDAFTIANTNHPDGTLVKTFGLPEVYLIINGQRYHVPNIDTFNSHGWSWSEVRQSTAPDKDLPSGGSLTFRGGTLIKGDSAPNVYVLRCMDTYCFKDWISSIEVFSGLGFGFIDVLTLPQAQVDGITQDKTITSSDVHLQDQLVLDNSSGKVYLIDTNTKRWVPSVEIFAANHYKWPKVKTVKAGDLALPDGGNVPFPEGALLRANGDNAVYAVNHFRAVNQGSTGSEKRHITSATTFSGLSYRPNDVFVIDSSYTAAYTTGATISE